MPHCHGARALFILQRGTRAAPRQMRGGAYFILPLLRCCFAAAIYAIFRFAAIMIICRFSC